jgi:hypothetical protein
MLKILSFLKNNHTPINNNKNHPFNHISALSISANATPNPWTVFSGYPKLSANVFLVLEHKLSTGQLLSLLFIWNLALILLTFSSNEVKYDASTCSEVKE